MTTKNRDSFPLPDSHTCLWYYQGDLNQEPRVAIVTSFGRRTGLNLTVFEDGRRDLHVVSGVRHKDDPFLKDHPTHATECGCWDYLPGQDLRVKTQPAIMVPNVASHADIIATPHVEEYPDVVKTGPGSRAFKK